MSTQFSINEYNLPEVLCNLIENDRWRVDRAELSAILLTKNAKPFDTEPYCLSVQNMKGQLGIFFGLERFEKPPSGGLSVWECYGFRSSKREKTIISLPWLDLDSAVPIILSTGGDQEVWLDYRGGENTPRVVSPVPNHELTDDRARSFIVISEDVTLFLDQIVQGAG